MLLTSAFLHLHFFFLKHVVFSIHANMGGDNIFFIVGDICIALFVLFIYYYLLLFSFGYWREFTAVDS